MLPLTPMLRRCNEEHCTAGNCAHVQGKVSLTLVKGRSSSVMRSNREDVWCIMRERLATSL